MRFSIDSNARFLLGNSIWLMIGQGGVQLFGMLLTILVARSLGDIELGQLTVMMTVIFLGSVLSTFGLVAAKSNYAGLLLWPVFREDPHAS